MDWHRADVFAGDGLRAWWYNTDTRRESHPQCIGIDLDHTIESLEFMFDGRAKESKLR